VLILAFFAHLFQSCPQVCRNNSDLAEPLDFDQGMANLPSSSNFLDCRAHRRASLCAGRILSRWHGILEAPHYYSPIVAGRSRLGVGFDLLQSPSRNSPDSATPANTASVSPSGGSSRIAATSWPTFPPLVPRR